MKASSFRYLINQGFKGIWKNRMMTFASFCILLVSLLMVGTSVLVSINLTRIIGGIEDKSEVIVIVKDGTSQADMQTLENKLKEHCEPLFKGRSVEKYAQGHDRRGKGFLPVCR